MNMAIAEASIGTTKAMESALPELQLSLSLQHEVEPDPPALALFSLHEDMQPLIVDDCPLYSDVVFWLYFRFCKL